MRLTLGHVSAPEGIAADEALLDLPGSRWWVSSTTSVVVGLGLHHRIASVVDLERCASMGVDVIPRRAGGGALLLDENVVCGAIALPISEVASDVTESYRWLGDLLAHSLRGLGIRARRLDIDEARRDVAALRSAKASSLLNTCYGALSPHEVVVDTPEGAAKLVGLAQVRRREVALFQFGILLCDQSPLADYLRLEDEGDRVSLRVALARRTIGLGSLTPRSASEVVEAIADAMPFAR
jgi:lipoate-protein ligase A